MKNIGIFDSGLGGLTVMQQVMQKLPSESIVYFGDTARVPYGTKSPETILRYCIENTQFLLTKEIKLLIVACNTATSVALEGLQKRFRIPIIGTIEAGSEQAVTVTKTGRIAVLGTKATIFSGAYQKAIKKLRPNATLFPIACPLFVPLVEENYLNQEASRLIVKNYLHPLKNQEIDTLLLGCTHYPLLKEMIQDEVGDGVKIVDSASTCAEKTLGLLREYQMEANKHSAEYEYYVSDDPERFQLIGSTVFGQQMPLPKMQEARGV